MVINQTVIDDYVGGLTEYISYISDNFLDMIIINDLKKNLVERKLIFAINIRRSLYNYGYSTGFFTDAELQYLLDQATMLTDELPNNSIYGTK